MSAIGIEHRVEDDDVLMRVVVSHLAVSDEREERLDRHASIG